MTISGHLPKALQSGGIRKKQRKGRGPDYLVFADRPSRARLACRKKGLHSWLWRIAKNQCLDLRKQDLRRITRESEAARRRPATVLELPKDLTLGGMIRDIIKEHCNARQREIAVRLMRGWSLARGDRHPILVHFGTESRSTIAQHLRAAASPVVGESRIRTVDDFGRRL